MSCQLNMENPPCLAEGVYSTSYLRSDSHQPINSWSMIRNISFLLQYRTSRCLAFSATIYLSWNASSTDNSQTATSARCLPLMSVNKSMFTFGTPIPVWLSYSKSRVYVIADTMLTLQRDVPRAIPKVWCLGPCRISMRDRGFSGWSRD